MMMMMMMMMNLRGEQQRVLRLQPSLRYMPVSFCNHTAIVFT